MAPCEREGRAEGEGLRRAILLQDAEEGARTVQTEVLGFARGCEAETWRSLRRQVRLSLRAARDWRDQQVREAVRETSCAASAPARRRARCCCRGARRH